MQSVSVSLKMWGPKPVCSTLDVVWPVKKRVELFWVFLHLSEPFWVWILFLLRSSKIKIYVLLACKFNMSTIQYRLKNTYLLSFSQICVYKSYLPNSFLKGFIFPFLLFWEEGNPKSWTCICAYLISYCPFLFYFYNWLYLPSFYLITCSLCHQYHPSTQAQNYQRMKPKHSFFVLIQKLSSRLISILKIYLLCTL